ncbi:MAG: hypothetical protein WAV73_05645 [Candidatus Moraniibacteriota bacterium]
MSEKFGEMLGGAAKSEKETDEKKKLGSKFRKVLARLGLAAMFLAPSSDAIAGAVTGKTIIDGKDRSQIGATDAGIERPRNIGSMPASDTDSGGELIGNDEKDPKDRIYQNSEDMAKSIGGVVFSDKDMLEKYKTEIR